MAEHLDSLLRLATFEVEKVMVLILVFKIIFQIMNYGFVCFKMEKFKSLSVHVERARVSDGRDQMNILMT